MNFPILERLAEVQERLGPILSDFGLKAKITQPQKDECIGFINDDGSLEHSVSLLLCDVLRKARGDWTGMQMRVSTVEEHEIGDNGWKINTYYDPEKTDVGAPDADTAFKQIEAALRQHPIIRHGDGHEGLIDHMFFSNCYYAVEEMIRDVTTSPINCERIDGVVSMSFIEEYSGDTWRIGFPKTDAVLTINDEPVGKVSALDRDALKMMIFKKIKDQHIPKLDLGY